MRDFYNEIQKLTKNDISLPSDSGLNAAVSIIFQEKESLQHSKILFIKRAVNPKDPWSGHIAFPGGKNEKNETLKETAERECFEEIGLDICKYLYLGSLSPKTPQKSQKKNKLYVHPFIYRQKSEESLSLKEDEVQSVFSIEIKELFDSRIYSYKSFTFNNKTYQLPTLTYQNHTIWGLTYVMLIELLSLISKTTHAKEQLSLNLEKSIWPTKPYDF